jgi:hypothetical protein
LPGIGASIMELSAITTVVLQPAVRSVSLIMVRRVDPM